MTTAIIIENYWKNHADVTEVIQFYVETEDLSNHEEIKESFSYIYDPETDEVEFSFYMTPGNARFPIYYTSNGKEFRMERNINSKFVAALVKVDDNSKVSTVILRIPAYGKLIRELYEENKSPVGLISPGDYNPTLGSNFYKDSNDNSYVTRDTFEDYVRSSNTEGHILDEVGRKQLNKNEGYYKIIKSLKIKCNALEKTVDSEGNYYSADRSTNSYLVYGVYTYNLYDADKNLLIEGVSEVTSHITIVNSTRNEYVGIGKLIVPVVGNLQSYNYTYVGHLYYEDFDGIIQTVQSDNHITLERFISAEFGIEDGTPKYYEGGYPLYIIGPYIGNSITFSIQVEGTINEENQIVYPEGDSFSHSFSNPQYSQYFEFVDDECSYNPTTGRIKIKIRATSDNNEDDPFRPSYAKILPSLERTTFKIYNRGQFVKSLEASYYIIQKSSKIGIIPKKYESRDSTTPIDMPRKDGKYILTVTGGIGIKTAFLGITSEVDPYDKNIVRSWTIRENMDFNSVYSEDDSEETNKILERQYFFENYSGALQDKIVFITGAYDGTLTEFYIRDYIDRSDVWRRAIYESEVTIVPEIDNTDRTVDLGGNWTYTLDTSTNYFIGSDLLYLFNENNRYYTQRFNLDFTFPPNSGPSPGNFRASIDDFGVTGPGTKEEEKDYTSEEGIIYTYYSSPRSIYLKLFGDADTYLDLKDRNKEGKWEKIEIKRDSLEYMSLQRLYNDDENSPVQMYIPTSSEPTECPIKNELNEIVTYLKLTTTDTGYPAFDEDNGRYVRYITEDESPLFFMFTTDDTGCAVRDKEGHQMVNEDDEPLFFDLTTNSTGYPAYKVIYEGYVDKYQSLVSIKYSRDKQIYFAYEGMENKDKKEGDPETKKTVKFDILYPQESRITTKDILRIPTINPLKFVFKLSGTTASYEVQEIRFYCGVEGIQPLELLSEASEKIPDPEAEYADYPEVELTKESNKYEVICQTSNELYPDWRVTSANNTFNYSAPNGNAIEFYNEETSLNFDESKGYLQIDLKNNLGGSDIIDFTRVKDGTLTTNWWNDWRFFIYNKFVNRFNIACSSGSTELEIKDGDDNILRDITLDRIGLYRIHISTSLGEDYDGESKTLSINIPTGIDLYQVRDLTFHNNNTNNLLKGTIKRGEKFPNSQYVQIDTNSSGTDQSSFVLYLWYEGSNVKIDQAKMYFLMSVGSGEKAKTLSKYITINQTNNSNLNDTQTFSGNLEQFFSLSAYKFNDGGQETEITGLPRQPINDFCLGFPIFNGRPGRIVLTNDNATFPYKLKNSINGDGAEFVKISTELKIDSPLSTTDYNNNLSLEEDGCYIKGSFISYSYDIRPDSYGIGYREEGSTIANQSTKSWRLSFMDSRNNNKSGDLYYYSPIDLKKFELRSPSAKYGKAITGRDINSTFRANEGYVQGEDVQDDNFLSEGNRNTVFYDYKTINACEVSLYHPNLQNDRLSIIKSTAENGNESPLEVRFVGKALDDSGNDVTASVSSTISFSNTDNISRHSIFLHSNNTDYEAFSWTRTGKTSLNVTLYTDSSVGSNNYTNIPLELLNQFGNSVGDLAKSVGWITTMVMDIKFEVIRPTRMSESLFNSLIINTSDPSYPAKSQYFGIGQEFINKITKIGDEIQACTKDGMTAGNGKNNPRFIIPLSWFKNSSPGYSHTIKIRANLNVSNFNSGVEINNSINKDLIYGAMLYEKDLSNSNQLGDPIQEVQFTQPSGSNDVIIRFGKEVKTDIILIPKFTNIEYNYFNSMEAKSSLTPTEYNRVWDTTKISTFKKINPNTSYISENIQDSGKTFSTTIDSSSFLGLKITGKRDEGNPYLERDTSPRNSTPIGVGLKNILSGFSATLSIWVDSDKSTPNAVETVKRVGYQNAILIQPGIFYQYTFEEAASNENVYYKLWYNFRGPQGQEFSWGKEPDGGMVQGDVDGRYNENISYLFRTVYILFPGRDDTLYMSLDRTGVWPEGDFYKEEYKIQVLELTKSLKTELPGPKFDIFGEEVGGLIVTPSVTDKEECHVVRRIYQTYSGNGNNSSDYPGDVIVVEDGEPRPPEISGPYSSGFLFNGNDSNYCTVGSYRILFKG